LKVAAASCNNSLLRVLSGSDGPDKGKGCEGLQCQKRYSVQISNFLRLRTATQSSIDQNKDNHTGQGRCQMTKTSNLHQLDQLRVQLRDKMSAEVDQLEARVRELSQSDRLHKDILIATYRKMIDRKQIMLRQL